MLSPSAGDVAGQRVQKVLLVSLQGSSQAQPVPCREKGLDNLEGSKNSPGAPQILWQEQGG